MPAWDHRSSRQKLLYLTMCSGSRDVLEQVTQHETVKTMSLLSLPERALVGIITDPAEPSRRVRTIKELGSCHRPSGDRLYRYFNPR